MTREEAIARIKIHKRVHKMNEPRAIHISEALEMAIKALEQEPCEDCISRQAMLDGLASIAKAKAKSDAQKALMGRVMFFTEQLPPVTPQPKTGHWNTYVLSHRGIDEEWLECSECMWSNALLIPRNYCPNCGARMESEG